ncbi:MAG: VWA domain-containing protein [Acidobacteriota bacterium]
MNTTRTLAIAGLFVCVGVLFGSSGFGAKAAAAQDKVTAQDRLKQLRERALAADAEDEAAGDLDLFVDVVNVNVVNVEVYVTDKKGNRINGLTRDDFEVFEDGKQVQISNFYAVEGGRPVAGDIPEIVPPSEAPEAIQAPPTEGPQLPPDQQLSLIIYIDNFNIRPPNRNRALRDIRTFLLQNVQPGDQVMLVSYERSIKIRRPFTTDPQVVASALTELERLTGYADQRDYDRRDTLDRIEDARSPSEALTWARSYAEQRQNDMRFTINALKEMVSSLAGLPGRKAILYVSDGIPMVAGQDLFHAVDGLHGSQSGAITEAFGYDTSSKFRELAAQANASRITFYTLDAAGLRVSNAISAENSRSEPLGIESINTSNLQSPLRYVAETTGGFAIINRNRFDGMLERVAMDFTTFYSLGYRAPETRRGRYHRIEVKLKDKKGRVVRHREGYRDKTVEARMTDGAMSVLHFNFERNPLGTRLEFGSERQRDRRFYEVPVKVRIPIGELVLIPREETHESRVRLYIAAMDTDGGTSPVQQQVVPISIPSDEIEQAKAQDYVYTLSLLMREGDHKVAVGVRDEVASVESFVLGSVRVGG